MPTFMEVLDTTIANVALNHIAGSMSASYSQATWVLTSYLISNAVVLPLTAWLGNRFQRKRFLLFCIFSSPCRLCFAGSPSICPCCSRCASFRALAVAHWPPSRRPSSWRAFLRASRDRAGALRARRSGSAGRRTRPGRLAHRQLLLALDLLHQHSLRPPRHVGHAADRRRSALGAPLRSRPARRLRPRRALALARLPGNLPR